MTLDRMAELGWAPDRVVSVQWRFGDRQIELKHPNGVLAKLLPSRAAVVLMPLDGRKLEVLNADGTVRLQIANEQTVDGKRSNGVFSWFEDLIGGSPCMFYVVFEAEPDHRLFLLDIDARTGKLLNARPTR